MHGINVIIGHFVAWPPLPEPLPVIDTHCHLLYDGIHERLERVLADARTAGVSGFVTIATTTSDALGGAALAGEHPDVWCTSGIHPLHAADPISWDDMHRAAQHPKCVAWGELGLDNHYADPPAALQTRVLEEQLTRITAWRNEGLIKPIVIHCRRAVPQLLPILRASGLPADRFVFHCFTETADDARAVLDFGAWISFTGVVTFRSAPEVAAAAKLVPDDRIMCETDAPFLSPEPVRGARPCVPAYVMHTGLFLAALRGTSFDVFERTVDANARRFFSLPDSVGRAAITGSASRLA
jgi:TatD DNase family protein